jgi:hypothetical protein
LQQGGGAGATELCDRPLRDQLDSSRFHRDMIDRIVHMKEAEKYITIRYNVFLV